MAKSMVTRDALTPTAWNDLGGSMVDGMQRINAYRDYRRTVRELSGLTASELAELGLHRSEIHRVAHDSVFGARR